MAVLAIIFVMAGMLLSAVARAKGRAGGIQCMSNNKQLTLAWHLYNVDNDGRLLFASASTDPKSFASTWVTGFLDGDPANRSNYDVEVDIKTSPLWKYSESAGIWKCPADRSGVKVKGRFHPRVRSMAMSIWIGGFGGRVSDFLGPNFRVYRNIADFIDPGPSGTWLLLDQREDSINYGNFFTAMHGWQTNPNDYRFIQDLPGSYHFRAAGISFVDGHAEIHRWQDARTMPKRNRPFGPNEVVSSPKNKDIQWLQEHATRKLIL